MVTRKAVSEVLTWAVTPLTHCRMSGSTNCSLPSDLNSRPGYHTNPFSTQISEHKYASRTPSSPKAVIDERMTRNLRPASSLGTEPDEASPYEDDEETGLDSLEEFRRWLDSPDAPVPSPTPPRASIAAPAAMPRPDVAVPPVPCRTCRKNPCSSNQSVE